MGKLTDNILKVICARNTMNGGNVVSQEVDLELPRGYVARIRKIEFVHADYHEDIDGMTSDKDLGAHMALLRDPDDTTTMQIPNNTVSHDVIDDFKTSIFGEADAGNVIVGIHATKMRQTKSFSEDEDVFTYRNLRFNCQGVGSDAADLTESNAECKIFYTLEKVQNAELMELMDIL